MWKKLKRLFRQAWDSIPEEEQGIDCEFLARDVFCTCPEIGQARCVLFTKIKEKCPHQARKMDRASFLSTFMR